MMYVFPFLCALALSCAICLLLLRTRLFRRWIRREREPNGPGGRRRLIPRWGGVAVAVAFLASALIDPHLKITPDLQGLFVGACAVLLFGLAEDAIRLSWKWQLAFQVSLAVGVYALGTKVVSINNPFGGAFIFDSAGFLSLSLVVVVAWFLLLMNTMNWIDGVDGLGSGVVVIAALTLFVLSVRPDVYQPPTAILSLALAGAFMGFLFFNFHPAKIFLGTAGSFFAGFALAYLSIFAGAKMATAMIVLALPVIDALRVLSVRFARRRSLFLADDNHLHHHLQRLGWSTREIVAFSYFVTVSFAFIALHPVSLTRILLFMVATGAILLFLLVMWRRVAGR